MIHNGLNGSIIGMDVNSSAGTQGIPAAPGSNPATLILDDTPSVDVTTSGNATPDQILVNTNLGPLKLSEIFIDIAITPSAFIYSNIRANYDNTTIYNYEPLNIQTSLPQLYQYNLSEINEMKMDILADVGNPNAYTIYGTTNIEPYKTILKAVNGKQPLTSIIIVTGKQIGRAHV